MRRITIVRLILTALATPFLVVVYLNIEKWAELHGYDQYLILLTSDQEADVISPLVAFALRSEMPFIATAVLAFVIGLWFDAWLRRAESTKINPADRLKVIGTKCVGLAETIDLNLFHWKYGDHEKIMSDRWADFLPIAFDLEKMRFDTPDRGVQSKEDLEAISSYLRFVGKLLAGGHLKEAKQTARNLSGNATRRNARFLPRWLQALGQRMWPRTRPG